MASSRGLGRRSAVPKLEGWAESATHGRQDSTQSRVCPPLPQAPGVELGHWALLIVEPALCKQAESQLIYSPILRRKHHRPKNMLSFAGAPRTVVSQDLAGLRRLTRFEKLILSVHPGTERLSEGSGSSWCCAAGGRTRGTQDRKGPHFPRLHLTYACDISRAGRPAVPPALSDP